MPTVFGHYFSSYRAAAQALYVPPGLAAEIAHLDTASLRRYSRDGRLDGYSMTLSARRGDTLYRLDGLALLRLRRAMARRRTIRRPRDWTVQDLDRAVDLLAPGIHARFQVERDMIRLAVLSDNPKYLTRIRIVKTQS